HHTGLGGLRRTDPGGGRSGLDPLEGEATCPGGAEEHVPQCRCSRFLPSLGPATGIQLRVLHARIPAVAAESSVAKCIALRIASGPSACSLIRTTRSSLIEVPVRPWSASQLGSPQVAGSRSRRCTEPQFNAMVSSVLPSPCG